MNDYWLTTQMQYRTDDIRREVASIHLAQSVRQAKSLPRIIRFVSAIKIASPRREKGGSHERAGRAILAVD